MKVNDYLEMRGISAEELAALLSERFDRKLAPGAVISRGEKELPSSWVNVLGDVPPDVVEAAEEAGAKPKQRKQPQVPKPTPDFNPMLAEERVAAIYAMVGKGVAAATKEPRYEKAFVSHADKCGHAWTELAKHDKHVATVLTALTAGGPWGEVLWLHLSLGFAIVVISGKVEIPLGGIIPSAAPSPAPTSDANGQGDASSANPVADA
jgi:hypothetical protein